MQNVGILNLSNLCQSYPYPPHSLSKSLVSPSSLQKKKKRTEITSSPSFRISSNKSMPGISYLSKDRIRGCVETSGKRVLPLDGGRSLTCRVLILKFRVAGEGGSTAWRSSPSRGEKRGEETLLLAHRPPLD